MTDHEGKGLPNQPPDPPDRPEPEVPPIPDPSPEIAGGGIEKLYQLYGEVQWSPTAGGCPDDPAVLCGDFKTYTAEAWYTWAGKASKRWVECQCGDSDELPTPPPQVVSDCSGVDESAGKCIELACPDDVDCENICDAYNEWAEDMRRWAIEFTAVVHVCFLDKWEPKVKVPKAQECNGGCNHTCKRIKKFHKKLANWAEDIRSALNDPALCPTGGGTDKVPSPPPPPFT